VGLALGILPIALTHSWTVGAIVESTVVLRMAELREFLTAIAFLMLALECRNGVSQHRAETTSKRTRLNTTN
jgi:hypothetical protein